MSGWDFARNAIGGVGVLASIWWVVYFVRLLAWGRQRRWLYQANADEPPGGWPRLAVIFAARNEAEHVEKATRSLLVQDYPNLEIVAVDDRSTDATGEILDRLAAVHDRLKVVHVRELPPQWLGKNHALQLASQAATADWLLFTDADVNFAPQALRKSVAEAVRLDAAHVVVIPELPTEGIGERLFMSMFLLQFALISPPWNLVNPRRKAFLGIGAFNLVRTEVWRSVGGFDQLRLSIDDDLQLGRLLKWSGFRSQPLAGWREVSVRWQVGLWGMIRGLEKNFFAALRFNVVFALGACLALMLIGSSIHLGLAIGPWWARVGCAAGIGGQCGVIGRLGWQNRVGWYYGLFAPIASLLHVFTLLRSTWLTLRRGGVTWRDHLYPIADLRDHIRQREAWMNARWAATHRAGNSLLSKVSS